MKRVSLCVKDKSKLENLRKIVKSKGLTVVKKNPEFVISLGGDGTFLYAEREYPGVPKILIRDSKVCKRCVGDSQETILDFIKMDAYSIEDYFKVEARFGNITLLGTNDIVFRNKNPNQALRFIVYVCNEKEHDELIGDGVVVSSTYGSTAYFKSITGESFKHGFGLAYNNPVEKEDPLFLSDKDRIKIKLLRGDAQIAVDNNPKIYTLKEGGIINFKLSKEQARIIRLEGFL